MKNLRKLNGSCGIFEIVSRDEAFELALLDVIYSIYSYKAPNGKLKYRYQEISIPSSKKSVGKTIYATKVLTDGANYPNVPFLSEEDFPYYATTKAFESLLLVKKTRKRIEELSLSFTKTEELIEIYTLAVEVQTANLNEQLRVQKELEKEFYETVALIK